MEKDNLVIVVANLIDNGYTEEFKIKCNLLYVTSLNRGLKMDEFDIDSSYKIVSDDNNEDAQRLFAITSKDKTIKGLLFDSLNNVEHIDSSSVQEKFSVNHSHTIIEDKDEQLKFGLKKINKAAFNQNPERYVFRKGFPDFPPCPFGNSFEALGWDTANNKYVWLVTSVLRDKRLVTEEYLK